MKRKPAGRGTTFEEYRQQKSADELTADNVAAVIRLEREVREGRSRTDRVVDKITRFSGSMTFVWAHVVWFGLWIGYDFVRRNSTFDPYPFQLLTLVVSLEAILLSALILISQNRDAKLSERRNHLALQIALLTEQENTKMLQILEKVARKVGVQDLGDPTLAVLEESTRPERLAQQIDRAMQQEEAAAQNDGRDDGDDPAATP
jgi:uncharacterized membrane protein